MLGIALFMLGVGVTAGCLLILWAIYTMIRVEWVTRVRLKVLDQGIHEFRKLPSYDTMMNYWWIWDIEELKDKR